MEVVTLHAFSDNYIFLLLDPKAPAAAVIDPGDPAPVFEFLKLSGRRLVAILNTHHHRDHVGGNLPLLAEYPGIPVYGGAKDHGRIPGQSVFVREGDHFPVIGSRAGVLDVPGHTRSHVAYFIAEAGAEGGDLFSGDTVFGGTIGNLFEGTPDVMHRSIQKIRALPLSTRIWCSHEYTLQYVREAAVVDPENSRLARRLADLDAMDAQGRPTVPLNLEEECATNPFFRWDNENLARRLATRPGVETFRRLCEIT